MREFRKSRNISKNEFNQKQKLICSSSISPENRMMLLTINEVIQINKQIINKYSIMVFVISTIRCGVKIISHYFAVSSLISRE